MKRILLFLVCTFILGLFSANAKEVYYRISQDELVQLNQFYQQCNGPNWIDKTGWPLPDGEQKEKVSACGLSFDSNVVEDNNSRTVYELSCVAISFDFNNNLSGTLPCFNLQNLQTLVIRYGNFSGGIPDFTMPKLQELSLTFDKLTGNIPNFKLPVLQKLDLSSNQLTGTIPNFNLENLQELYIQSNQLSGSIPGLKLFKLASADFSSNLISDINSDIDIYSIDEIMLQNNKLTFKSLNKILKYRDEALYAPQDTMYTMTVDSINCKLSVIDDNVSADNAHYKWYKDGKLCEETTDKDFEVSKNAFWFYIACKVSNSNWPQLEIDAKFTKLIQYKIDSLERVQLNNFYYQCNGVNWYKQYGWPLKDTVYTMPNPPIAGLIFDTTLTVYNWSKIAYSFNVRSISLVNNNLLGGVLSDFTFPNLKSFYVDQNKFTFKELEYFSDLQTSKCSFGYWYQDTILPLDFDNTTRRLTVKTEGKYNTYKWYKLYSVVKNSSDNFITLSTSDNPDDYGCVINNTLFTELTLCTRAPLGTQNWLSVYPAFDVYNISLYPNPCVNNISVDYHFDYSGTVTAKIYDTGGNLQLTLDGIPPEGTQQINLSNFSNGMYNLIFEFGDEKVVGGSFVVVR